MFHSFASPGCSRLRIATALFTLALATSATFATAPSYAFDKKVRQEEALNRAAALGRSLADKVQRREQLSPNQIQNYREVMSYIESRGCPGYHYQLYQVKSGGQAYLYLLGFDSNHLGFDSNHVIIGRHFRFPMQQDRVDLGSAVDSTTTCLNLGRPARDSFMRVIHPDELPNEFHVAQSMIANVTLEVHTRTTIFLVNRGRVINSRL